MDKNIEALMRRIANGEDPEAVGQEFTKALNQAVKEKNSKSEREKKMRECADRIATNLKDYIRYAEPRMDAETLNMVTGEFIKSVLDEGLKETSALFDLKDMFVGSKETKDNKKAPEAILASFLKENGLM